MHILQGPGYLVYLINGSAVVIEAYLSKDAKCLMETKYLSLKFLPLLLYSIAKK